MKSKAHQELQLWSRDPSFS